MLMPVQAPMPVPVLLLVLLLLLWWWWWWWWWGRLLGRSRGERHRHRTLAGRRSPRGGLSTAGCPGASRPGALTAGLGWRREMDRSELDRRVLGWAC